MATIGASWAAEKAKERKITGEKKAIDLDPVDLVDRVKPISYPVPEPIDPEQPSV